MTQLELLNESVYSGLQYVEFPATVEGELSLLGMCYLVSGAELIRVGADPDRFMRGFHYAFSEIYGEVRKVVRSHDQ